MLLKKLTSATRYAVFSMYTEVIYDLSATLFNIEGGTTFNIDDYI